MTVISAFLGPPSPLSFFPFFESLVTSFPFFALYVLSNQKTRKPKRLYKKLGKMYDKLSDDYFKNPVVNVKKSKKKN